MTQSPEITGRYLCPACGNASAFTGHDARGFPGDDCDCGADPCACEVELCQDFDVGGDGEVRYGYHNGAKGSEIGDYTRIDCRACGAMIWRE